MAYSEPVYSDGSTGGTSSTGTSSTGGTSAVIGTVTPVASAPASVVASGGMNTGDFRIVCPVVNRAYTGEAYPVPAGAIVEIFPLYGNTKPVRVALYPAAAELGGALASSIAPGAVAGRQFPVRNLAEIWVAAEVAGEGVAISIRSK